MYSWEQQLEGAVQDILTKAAGNQTDILSAITMTAKHILQTVKIDMEKSKYVPWKHSRYAKTKFLLIRVVQLQLNQSQFNRLCISLQRKNGHTNRRVPHDGRVP